MIPKIIHYCWFGGKPKPKLALHCIESWKKYCPDYEYKEWNESNFDLDLFPYAREAYDAKKYAFVTDLVRLYALYHEGGIYMDTDVELLHTLDPYLHHHAFSGFETEVQVPTGIMASEKGGKWAKENLDYYIGKSFLLPDGTPDTTTNVQIITSIMIKHGLRLDNSYQDIEDYFTMYPSDYFCPKHPGTHILTLTANSVCIHHFNMSWQTNYVKRFCIIRDVLMRVLPHNAATFCARKINGLISRTLKLFTNGKYS